MIIREEDEAFFLPLSRLGAPQSEYRGAVVEDAWFMNPAPSLVRAAERFAESDVDPMIAPQRDAYVPGYGTLKFQQEKPVPELSPMLSPAEANLRYKDLGLKFSAPVRERVAQLMAESKVREQSFRDIYERARVDGGLGFSGKALSVGLELLTTVADPLNIASAFVPIVREARWAQWALRMGVPGARVARGTIEGAVGAALVEPFVLLNALDEQLDYSAINSLINIAFGAGAGGGLHWLGGYGRDRVRGRWSPEDLRDMAAGRSPVVDPVELLDMPGFRDLQDEVAFEMARRLFQPAERMARRAEAEADGRSVADYTVFADEGRAPVFRGRYEPPEPWGATMEALSADTREAIIKGAVAQAVDGRRIDVEPIAQADPAYRPPNPEAMRLLAEVSPSVLRWALEEGAGKPSLRAERLAAQGVPSSLIVGRSKAALTAERTLLRSVIKMVADELGFVMPGFTKDALGRTISVPAAMGFTPPAAYTPSSGAKRFAGIIKGDEKPPQTFMEWVRQKGGIWDESGELAARDIRAGKKGVPPGLINNRRNAVELGTKGEKGLSVADMADEAFAEGWLGGQRRESREMGGYVEADESFDKRTAFLDLLSESVGGGKVYHPESDFVTAKGEADTFLDVLLDAGLDVKDMSARDVAYLYDRPELLGQYEQWRYVNGLLDDVQSQDVALRLMDEIEVERATVMDELAAMWRAEQTLESVKRSFEGFDPEELPRAIRDWEKQYAEIEQRLAEHEESRARARDNRDDEAGAVVVAADEGQAGAGRAADDGADAAAREAGEGARPEGQGAVVEPDVARDSKVLAKGETPPVIDIGEMANLPREAADVKGYVVYKVTKNPDGTPKPAGYYEIYKDGKSAGSAMLRDNNRQVGGVTVSGPFQRQGIGQMLYATIERDIGARLTPTETLTGPGKALWAAYEKSDWRKVEPTVEKTAQGTQTVLPGAERITPEEMNARVVAKGMAQSLVARIQQDQGFGLFDVQGRGQADLLNVIESGPVDALVAKYGRDPATLEQRIDGMRVEQSQLARMAGAKDKLTKLQRDLANSEAALQEIRAREARLEQEAPQFAERQMDPANDANVEPRNEVAESYAAALQGTDEARLKAEVERLELELGDRVDAETKAAMGDLDRQAADFEAAGLAYLVCKAGDGA